MCELHNIAKRKRNKVDLEIDRSLFTIVYVYMARKHYCGLCFALFYFFLTFHMLFFIYDLVTFCRNLRELFKIDAADYMMSICGNDALRELSSPGKSGSVFFLSQDDRFMIKTLRRSEVKVCLFYVVRVH